MKRFAFIATNEFDAFAGSEILWAEAAKRLANHDSDVFVNAPSWGTEPVRIAGLRQQSRVRFDVRPTTLSTARRLLAKIGISSNESFFELYRTEYLRDVRPDMVVISQGGLVDGVGWMEACAGQRVPFTPIVHLVADALWPTSTMVDRAITAYRNAAQIYFVSEENRRSAERQLGTTFANSAIVRNPFNVSYETAPCWPEETGVWRLACVGRLGAEHKGQDLLIEVLSLSKWRKRPLSVTLFGKGHHKSLLEKLIELRGCSAVSFGGYTDGISEIWRTHHAALVPSRYEGLPIALVEAMLCHRLAIVTDVGGNAELVEERVTGFIAQAPNVASVDAALERAWQHRDHWRAMGLSAGKRVRSVVPSNPVEVFLTGLRSK